MLKKSEIEHIKWLLQVLANVKQIFVSEKYQRFNRVLIRFIAGKHINMQGLPKVHYFSNDFEILDQNRVLPSIRQEWNHLYHFSCREERIINSELNSIGDLMWELRGIKYHLRLYKEKKKQYSKKALKQKATRIKNISYIMTCMFASILITLSQYEQELMERLQSHRTLQKNKKAIIKALYEN